MANGAASITAWCSRIRRALRGFTCATTHTRAGLRMEAGAQLLADEALDAAGRSRLVVALTYYVQSLAENPLKDHPERLPVKLVGDDSRTALPGQQAGLTALQQP